MSSGVNKWYFKTRNWSHIATHLVVVWRTSSEKPMAPSFQIRSGWNLAGMFFK